MVTNLEDFIAKRDTKNKVWLGFSTKNIMLSVSGVKKMLDLGFKRATVRISKDLSTIAVVGVNEGGCSLLTRGKVENLSFCNSFITNVVAGKTKNGKPKYEGVVDEENKCIFFDLANPIF